MILTWKICQIFKISKREWFSFTIWKVCQVDANDSHLQSLANQLVTIDSRYEIDYHLQSMGRAGGTRVVGGIYIDVTHFTKLYNINQLPRYAIILPMSYGVLNNNMMGVIKLGWVRLGYDIYITGGTLQFYCKHYFQLCQVFCKINLKTLKHLTNLTNDTIINT